MKLKIKKLTITNYTHTMSNSTQVTNILLRAGFVDANHVKRSIAIEQGNEHKNIAAIKANAVANLEADCKNGVIRKAGKTKDDDDFLLAIGPFKNHGIRKLAVGSGYESYSEDGTSLTYEAALW
jgi:hypothetical protein